MDNEKVPEWAYDRLGAIVGDRSYATAVANDPKVMNIGHAFARYIAEHEEPPVDPLLVEARQIAGDAMASHETFGQTYSTGSIHCVRTGNDDGSIFVRTALNALRRGTELAARNPTREDSHAG